MPAEPRALVAAGQHNRIPVIVGSNAHEGTTLFAGMPEVDEATYRAGVEQTWGDLAGDILDAYADDAAVGPDVAQRRILSDQYFAWQMRAWARAHTGQGDPAWLYYFSHVPDLGGEYGTSMGAFHAAEIPYAFGNPTLGFGDGGDELSTRASDLEVTRLMTGYWTNFAKTGDPNGEGLPRGRGTRRTPTSRLRSPRPRARSRACGRPSWTSWIASTRPATSERTA